MDTLWIIRVYLGWVVLYNFFEEVCDHERGEIFASFGWKCWGQGDTQSGDYVHDIQESGQSVIRVTGRSWH